MYTCIYHKNIAHLASFWSQNFRKGACDAFLLHLDIVNVNGRLPVHPRLSATPVSLLTLVSPLRGCRASGAHMCSLLGMCVVTPTTVLTSYDDKSASYLLQSRVNNRRESIQLHNSSVETLAKVMWQVCEKPGIIMCNDSWWLLVHKRNCTHTNRTKVHWVIIKAKQTVPSQSDDKYEDEPGTKRPQDFLAVLYETGAETYGDWKYSTSIRINNVYFCSDCIVKIKLYCWRWLVEFLVFDN